jgi:LuxR family transcriptional regulator, maltose regulon positive regulatory protein
MLPPILATKLYIPPLQPTVVRRPRLIERLNEGLHRKLTMISAPAGFGKTTLVSEWIAGCRRPVAWLSLDGGDNDPIRFLTYLVAALQTLVLPAQSGTDGSEAEGRAAQIGAGVLAGLQTPQPLSTEAILIALLNDIAAVSDHFILILDDYHSIEAKSVDQALTFLLEHLPPQMHLVIATREDPILPLARLRARGQLTELRAADLRFTPTEVAEFLNQMMGLNLSADDIAALETRTEGWIAGLQLAALSMQGVSDAAGFITSFTGSHRFVLDYLVEEVLHRQPEHIQLFLLHTSILERLCGPLCEAILGEPAPSGQATLEYLERANLFIVTLDNERRWYRYHHLFAELLRQRLHQSLTAPTADIENGVNVLHLRASQWYEEHGLELEAFHHAAAARDIDRAVRLIESKGMPSHFRGVANAILDWLASLPNAIKDARPVLWVKSATFALVAGQTTGVEERLQTAEKALQYSERDAATRNLIGQIAAARATLALTRYQADEIIVQARRALEYLPPENLAFRFTALWALGVAHSLQGERAAALQADTEALAISEVSGEIFSIILANSALGEIQELNNQLHAAAASYRRILQLSGDHPLPNVAEAHLGLARINYEWNDPEAAERHGQQSLQLARQYDRVIDRFVICEVLLARLKLAQGDVTSAAEMIAQTDQAVCRQNFVHRLPEVAAVQVLVLLRQGKLAEAERVAQTHTLPLSQVRVLLAQGNPSAALAILDPLRQQMEIKGWHDERLKIMILQTLAFQAQGETENALTVLHEALTLAEPEGFIRSFVDEGEPMRLLIADWRLQIARLVPGHERTLNVYAGKLLAAFPQPDASSQSQISNLKSQMLLDPLSERELEVLRLIAQGLSNQAIGERLFLALDTIKGHNRKIFDKLNVKSRTEAVARARELGLL